MKDLKTLTHLEKTAAIAEAAHDGEITAEQADAMAESHGIDLSDLSAVYTANYLGKEASEQDLEATYLEKTAQLVDAFAADEIDEAQLSKIAEEHGISMSDVKSVFGLAYGEELKKQAALQEADEILLSEYAGYLKKVASVAGLYLDNHIDQEQVASIAEGNNLQMQDLIDYVSEAEAGSAV